MKTDNLAKEGSLIVERFYDTVFTGLPESVRDFSEQCLITTDGVRLPYPLRSIATEQLATAEQIQKLIDKRLIHRENHEDGDRIELVHDRLAQIVLQRRQAGAQRKQALQQQKIRRRWVIGIVTVFIALIVFAGLMFDARQQAPKAKTKAQQAWLDATAMRLAAEGESMTSGARFGGTNKGCSKYWPVIGCRARPIPMKLYRLNTANTLR
ncbi:hypothetical protein [Nitrosomonas aestuarii]|uniref:hypothetical protein n=1 Tax=Nitrosomonas aestuarii TaxID=52441 RepID=UPI0011B2099E|nr:hypothetical protein [Nitrosomonas aestuarii]